MIVMAMVMVMVMKKEKNFFLVKNMLFGYLLVLVLLSANVERFSGPISGIF